MIDTEEGGDGSVPFNALHLLPAISGVYIAENDREDVLYIGSARNLRRRWQDHHRLRCVRDAGCARIVWVDCPAHDLNRMEKMLIRHFRPLLNRNGMGKSKDPDYESTTIILRKAVKYKAQSLLVSEKDRGLSDVIDKLLEDWINKQSA